MGKKTVTHSATIVDLNPKTGKLVTAGRPKVNASTLPKRLRGYDPEYDVHTFTEGPLARLLGKRR